MGPVTVVLEPAGDTDVARRAVVHTLRVAIRTTLLDELDGDDEAHTESLSRLVGVGRRAQVQNSMMLAGECVIDAGDSGIPNAAAM